MGELKAFVEFVVASLAIGAWVIVVLMLPDAKSCSPGDAGQSHVRPYGVSASRPIDGCRNGADERTSMPSLDERRSP